MELQKDSNIKMMEGPKNSNPLGRVERIVGHDDGVILYTSDEAAKFVTDIKGWVSRDGFFYGDNKDSEDIARYVGCTHRACKDCGKPTEKRYTICARCQEVAAVRRYQTLELIDWDGKTPLYSDAYDQYFFDEDDAREFIDDLHQTAPEVVRLLLCEPVKLSHIDEDYWCDDLAEDGELPDSVFKALNDLNTALDDAGPLAWFPGKFRVSI